MAPVMKVLHVPFHYFPDAVGGTEIYTAALAERLQGLGVEVAIAAPGHEPARYTDRGIAVHRFGITSKPPDVSMLYGEGDPEAAYQFRAVLHDVRPDLVHLHAMSPAVSLNVLREIKQRGIPAVFTCHIPGITCSRGTLLRNGAAVCDGIWALAKCSSCVLQGKGLPLTVARPLGHLPVAVGRGIALVGFRGSVATALRMTELQSRRQQSVAEFLDRVDRIVVVSGWLRDMMLANGIPTDKVVLSRHGSTSGAAPRTIGQRTSGVRLKVVFIGRLNPAKGAHVLLEALLQRPELPVDLDLFGIVQDDDDYVAELTRQAAKDARVRLLAPLSRESVVPTLRQYDVLAVPSVGMETGPLVVCDAFEAGLAVVGSFRGGISELVQEGRNGLLVDPANPRAWGSALARLCEEPSLLATLRAAVRPVRTMDDVAAEMVMLYRGLCVAN
jgi:glycosyltransferase involved in cell wall biosynthesis